ncbi:MAG: serine hydrolase [bacterium]|nr:serine hydrolase [bacterium]
MRFKLILLFIFFTLLFLFYPGDTHYFHIFAFNKETFNQVEKNSQYTVRPIPYLKSNYFPEISAEGIYVADLDSFTPILKRNEHQQFLPASTTKIITALVAVDNAKPDDIITVKRPISEGQVIGLVRDEKLTLENLLFGLLVYSGNDAAYVIADNFGFDHFITLMNQKAKDLHMIDSHFSNPAGLDDYAQLTTPYDLALASRELLKNKLLSRVVSTRDITISDVDFKYFHRLTNVNKLLGEIQGLGGLKTGYTENAGENLVSFYKHNGHQFVMVVLKSADRFTDTKNLVTWMNDNVDFITP